MPVLSSLPHTTRPTGPLVGYLSNWGYWFRVIDSRLDEDDQDIEIDSGGIDSEMPHLVQLIQDCGMYVDWTQHTDVLRELAQYDAALTSQMPRVRRCSALPSPLTLIVVRPHRAAL